MVTCMIDACSSFSVSTIACPQILIFSIQVLFHIKIGLEFKSGGKSVKQKSNGLKTAPHVHARAHTCLGKCYTRTAMHDAHEEGMMCAEVLPRDEKDVKRRKK